MKEFVDRTPWLIVFGGMQILLGVAATCALLGTAAMTEIAPQAAPPRGLLTMNITFYLMLAIYFFSVGIGSIRRKRWARSLSVVVSAWWLAVGVASIVFTAVAIPHLKVLVAPSREKSVFAVIFGILLLVYVALPLLLLLFYRGASVRGTCEAADARVRWTDRVPPAVLGMVVALAFTAMTMFAATSYAVVPLLGTILTGGPAILVSLSIAVLFAFLALQFYRLRRSAWWTLVLLQVVGIVAGVITVMRTDLDEVYAKMGLLTPQVEAMRLKELYASPLFWCATVAAWGAFLAFTLSTRRYFDSPMLTRASDGVVDAAEDAGV